MRGEVANEDQDRGFRRRNPVAFVRRILRLDQRRHRQMRPAVKADRENLQPLRRVGRGRRSRRGHQAAKLLLTLRIGECASLFLHVLVMRGEDEAVVPIEDEDVMDLVDAVRGGADVRFRPSLVHLIFEIGQGLVRLGVVEGDIAQPALCRREDGGGGLAGALARVVVAAVGGEHGHDDDAGEPEDEQRDHGRNDPPRPPARAEQLVDGLTRNLRCPPVRLYRI